MKKFNLTVIFILGVVLAPALLFAASEVVIGYANISARVSPLWIAQEKGFFAKFGVNVQQVYIPALPSCRVTAKPWSYSKSSPAPTRCRKGKGTPMGYDITLINLNVLWISFPW